MNNQVSKKILIAEEAYKNKDYLTSYSLYKKIYRESQAHQIIARLVDIAFITLKQTNTKLEIINNLIDIGLKKNNEVKYSNELFYLKLKLLREFKKFSLFNELYNSLKSEQII